jgi:DUF1680 family protein
MGKAEVPFEMSTNYPLDGEISIAVNPQRRVDFALKIRLPGWAREEAVPGGLYKFEGKSNQTYAVMLNGRPVAHNLENGYITIDRKWSKGDVVTYKLPMEIRKIRAREEVEANKDRIALQRGPLVYCVEGADNGGNAWNIVIPESSQFEAVPFKVLEEKVMAIQGEVNVLTVSEDGKRVDTQTKTITAIPYYTWANRGANEMQVWLPTKVKELKVNY